MLNASLACQVSFGDQNAGDGSGFNKIRVSAKIHNGDNSSNRVLFASGTLSLDVVRTYDGGPASTWNTRDFEIHTLGDVSIL